MSAIGLCRFEDASCTPDSENCCGIKAEAIQKETEMARRSVRTGWLVEIDSTLSSPTRWVQIVMVMVMVNAPIEAVSSQVPPCRSAGEGKVGLAFSESYNHLASLLYTDYSVNVTGERLLVQTIAS